jgi:hypothetical protein
MCTSPFPIIATCPAYFILDLITRILFSEEYREYRSLSLLLCSLIHAPVTSSLLGPNIFLGALFSNTLSIRSSLNVSDQVSHPYKTTGKTTFLYTLIFIFFDRKTGRQKILHRTLPMLPLVGGIMTNYCGIQSTNSVHNYLQLPTNN